MENKLWRITLDTNPEDCNLNCIMCEEHSHYSDFREKLYRETGLRKRRMPIEWLENIISQAYELGVTEVIPTTMGDPLVTDHIFHLIQSIKKYGIKLNITHNGTFPGRSIEEWAKMIVPVTSDIKISWNGASTETAESIMKGLNYEKAVSDLSEFINFRDKWAIMNGHYCSVTLQLTFMRSNMHEIEMIIKLAADLGVDRIKGHHVWVNFPELQPLSFFCTEESILEWNSIVDFAKTSIIKYPKKNGQLIRLENFDYVSNLSNKSIPDHYNCPFLGKELWISATGKISPCCAPDELRSALGDFGNISESSLKQVIKSEKYRSLVMNYKNYNLCKTCTMRKPS